MPPPNTRFNSASLVTILSSSVVTTLFNAIAFDVFLSSLYPFQLCSLLLPLSKTSSIKVFHELQEGHLPNHLALS